MKSMRKEIIAWKQESVKFIIGLLFGSRRKKNYIPIGISWSETMAMAMASHFDWWFSIKTIRKWTTERTRFSRHQTYLNWKWLPILHGKRFFFLVRPQDFFVDVHRKWRLQASAKSGNCLLWLKSCVSMVYKSRRPNFNFISCLFSRYEWRVLPENQSQFQSKSWTKVKWGTMNELCVVCIYYTLLLR